MNIVDDPDFPHTTVQVETKTGDEFRGATYAPAVDRTLIVEDGRKQVRGADGQLTVSETTLFDHLDAAGLYPVGTRVTVNGRAALVITAKRRELDDVSHVEVNLT